MAALLRLLAARCRESVLARPYGGVAGGGRDGARRRSGAGGGGGADRRGTGGRRSSRARRGRQDHGGDESAGGERSRDAGGRGPRGQHDDGAGPEGGADHGHSFWSRIRDRARRHWGRYSENLSPDSPSLREIFDEVESTVELFERVEKLPGRVYDLSKKIQKHLTAAGFTVGTVGIFLKGKIKETVSAVKEKLSSVKDQLSSSTVSPDEDEGDDCQGPGPFDFSM